MSVGGAWGALRSRSPSRDSEGKGLPKSCKTYTFLLAWLGVQSLSSACLLSRWVRASAGGMQAARQEEIRGPRTRREMLQPWASPSRHCRDACWQALPSLLAMTPCPAPPWLPQPLFLFPGWALLLFCPGRVASHPSPQALLLSPLPLTRRRVSACRWVRSRSSLLISTGQWP